MQIILPKMLSYGGRGPLFFLMGPIRGADDWQAECCKELAIQLGSKEFQVAVPCRYDERHPLFEFKAEGEIHFARQLPWERYFIDQAANRTPEGCVVIWLPKESAENPRPRESGPYARDTYGELGELRGRMMRGERIRFALGAHSGFSGLDVIVRNFEHALNKRMPVASSLEELVGRAIEVAQLPLAPQ